MPDPGAALPPVDFDLATSYLQQAKEAHRKGDVNVFIAARKLITLCLGQDDPGTSKRAQ